MPRRAAAQLLAWAPFILLSVVHVSALAAQSPLAAPTKLTLMPALAIPVLVAMRNLRPRAVPVLLLAALFFSWLGDGAGTFFPWAPELPLMLLFFGIAHVAYILLFARHLRSRRLPLWAAIYAVWWVGMLVILGPEIGPLVFGVAIYGLVLAGTATTATMCHPLVAIGGVFFLASDSILAFRLFMPESMPQWTSPAVMLTYTLGQGLIVAGALIGARTEEAR